MRESLDLDIVLRYRMLHNPLLLPLLNVCKPDSESSCNYASDDHRASQGEVLNCGGVCLGRLEENAPVDGNGCKVLFRGHIAGSCGDPPASGDRVLSEFEVNVGRVCFSKRATTVISSLELSHRFEASSHTSFTQFADLPLLSAVSIRTLLKMCVIVCLAPGTAGILFAVS